MYLRSTKSYPHKMKKQLFKTFLLFSCLLISSKTFAQVKNYPAARTDTLTYKASAFVIQPNDKLDNLLRQMPSISFDKDGKIYAQGDTIKRILVDGDEFFGDDPLVVAQVLRADKVDQIKIYWRWSDQATFTGIEDKVKWKTINVILKKI